MARARFPDDADKASISGSPGTLITICTDSRGKVPADIQTYPAGDAISDSKVALDSNGLIPDFYSPDPAPLLLFAFSPDATEGAELNPYKVEVRQYVPVDGGPP